MTFKEIEKIKGMVCRCLYITVTNFTFAICSDVSGVLRFYLEFQVATYLLNGHGLMVWYGLLHFSLLVQSEMFSSPQDFAFPNVGWAGE